MFTIATDADSLARELQGIATRQIPNELKLAINQTAKAVLVQEQDAIRRLFDRPTPFAVSGLRVTQWATEDRLSAEIGFKDVFGPQGKAVERALMPHVPGFAAVREPKGAERWLIRDGFMQRGEYLVPSRTMKLDRYGNVPGPLMQKMLADVGAYSHVRGFTSTTKTRKARYVFGQVRGRNGRLVKGIWWVEGGRDNMARGRWKLMMLVVRAPTYQRRVAFPFWEIADRFVEEQFPKFLAAGLAKTFARAESARGGRLGKPV